MRYTVIRKSDGRIESWANYDTQEYEIKIAQTNDQKGHWGKTIDIRPEGIPADLHARIHAQAEGETKTENTIGKARYKYRDPDKWRAYMREYMRKRRSKKR